MNTTSRIGGFLALAALCWHALTVLSPAWTSSFAQQQARDFASYYYAVQVAESGGDPYAKPALNAAARLDGYRSGVHPFLYAPPFLLGMAWVPRLALPDAFHLWFWLDEVLAIAAAIALWRWWRPLSPSTGWIVAVVFALMNAVPNNHAMGQANFPGLLLALVGLWQTDRGRPLVGGAAMGAACMLKMSPALFVVWWLVRREWRAVGAAIATGALLSLASLPLASPAVQWRFYTEILPTFSDGGYNGLAVSIGLFGNHSIPNLLNQVWRGPGVLSPVAHALSAGIALALLGGAAVLFRRPDPDPLQRAAQASTFAVLLLLIPVYTYEHHLVFALPPAVIAVIGAEQGRLGRGWTLAVGVSLGVLLFDLQYIRAIAEALERGPLWWLAGVFQELKSLALFALLGATTLLGARPVRA